MDVDLNLLRTFLTILDQGSVTAAADELHLTQPTVSHALGRLRRQVGDPLFVRLGSGLVPTARALELEPVVRAALTGLDRALSSTTGFDPTGTARRFRLCLSDVGESSLLGPVVRTLSGEAPRASLEAVPTRIDAVSGWLRRGEVDAAVASVPLDVDGSATILARERYVALLPAGVRAASGVLAGSDLAGLRRAVVAKEAGHRMLDDVVASLGLDDQAVVQVQHFSVLPQLVRTAGLVAFVPAQMADSVAHNWGLSIAELPASSPRYDVRLYWDRTLSDADEARAWFIDLVRRTLTGLTPPPDPFAS